MSNVSEKPKVNIIPQVPLTQLQSLLFFPFPLGYFPFPACAIVLGLNCLYNKPQEFGY